MNIFTSTRISLNEEVTVRVPTGLPLHVTEAACVEAEWRPTETSSAGLSEQCRLRSAA